MDNYEGNSSIEAASFTEQKGYVDSEGNEKCQKEKKAQITFLKERDEKRKNAKAAYQAYKTKITECVTSHDGDCASGTATAASRWETCPNTRFGTEGENGEEDSSSENEVPSEEE